jgi:hypothetical protein
MMLLFRLLVSLVLSVGLLSFVPRLEAQHQSPKDRANALQPRIKNQDNTKKKAPQPASKKAGSTSGFVAKPSRKDVKRGGPSMLNKKKTFAAAAAGSAAAAASSAANAPSQSTNRLLLLPNSQLLAHRTDKSSVCTAPTTRLICDRQWHM